ncbi:DUF1549 domain-containing protein [Prosthecobacter sp. SYSU 5D2]|uniref:DUF1549 domain-containing protein n=1 Tax=Prosthecobacter sp. SYSU 5D2 TaxID=3134134 RepID=UPI0031FE69D4
MKATKYMLAGLLIAGFGSGSATAAELRTWTDVEGRQVSATFVQIDGDAIVLQTGDGAQHRFPLARLSAEDQAVAKAAQSAAPAESATAAAAPQMLANATVAQAAAKIDQLVANGLIKANPTRASIGKAPIKSFNPMANDEQFVRRVYLDIAGRIPNFEEATSFIQNKDPKKRANLIDMLLESDGYKTHLYNYFAEMLRIKDEFEQDNVRGTPYIKWFKEQIAKNEKWDKMVYQMVTATGKMWDKLPDGSYNGAAGYLLRDAGMPLDNLANTLTVFLGTDVACAQCHDHPFADWTQKQFYEMAAFFGATTTRLNAKDFGGTNPVDRLMAGIEPIIEKSGQDLRRQRNGIQNFLRANTSAIKDRDMNSTKLPHDYQYKDGKPGDPVAPKFVTWSAGDKNNPAYKQKKGTEEKLRLSFANWMTHPENPRFAMTIANRMWKRAFGAAVNEPVTNIDDPEQSVNPELLMHLAQEMKRVKFDLKEFMRIVYNTRAYQSEATSENIALGELYYFQGPMLRRMSAEQAWDSYMTLVLGKPDEYKAPLQDLYARSIDMNLETVDAQTALIKYSAYRDMQNKERALMGGGLDMVGGDSMMMDGGASKKDAATVAAADGPGKILTYEGMRLMRSAEIQQPAPGGHFLIDFGQSPRMIIDGSTRIGNVPQVLTIMNGKAQKMLTSRDSLVFRTMDKVNSQPEKVEHMFMTILNRRPTMQEKDIAKRALAASGEEGYSNMIWALINTREFMFIQ